MFIQIINFPSQKTIGWKHEHRSTLWSLESFNFQRGLGIKGCIKQKAPGKKKKLFLSAVAENFPSPK